ncbi:tetratricopeptide repeat protein [Alteromonas sp. 14N.309.X.WAT.G.H12]|uniref:tetratricopeptide repeat protein n=1 Tax=Alteromonas sp. 14N.309.X.WAT.G.H12 TaxID=3120824 RepID=UPI002FD4495A
MKKTLLALVIGATFTLSGCNQKETADSITHGNDYFTHQDYRAASIEYKSALQLDPTLVEARIGLAKIALATRDFTGALTELERARDYQVEQGGAVDEISTLIARAAHRGEADTVLMDLPGEGKPETAYYQLIRLVTDGKQEDASQLFATIKEKDSPFTTLSRALMASVTSSTEAALALMPDSTEDYDDVQRSEFALLLTGLAVRNGKIQDGVKALELYYQLNPLDYVRALQLSRLLVEERRFDDAAPIITALNAKFPQHGMISELMAIIAYEKKDFDTAMSSASAAIVVEPNSSMARLVYAYSAMSLGDNETALEALEYIIDRLPQSHPAQRLYIKLKAANGEAADVAERALDLSNLTPLDAPLLSALGMEMLRAGDINVAKKFADKAEHLGATGKARSMLGLLQLSVGDDAAFDNLEEAFLNAPESKFVGNNLATAYLSEKRFDDAYQLGDKLVGDGKYIDGTMLKAVAKSRMGELVDAEQLFTDVLSKDPQHFMARAGKIEVEVKLDHRKKAALLFDEWVVEEGMAGLFRNYIAVLRNKGADTDVRAAIDHYDNLIDNGKITSEPAKLMSAQAHFIVNDIPQAKSRLDSVKDTHLRGAEFWLLSATVNERLNNTSDALDDYRAWHELSPSAPIPVMGMMRMLTKQGRVDDAILALDAAMPELENPLPARVMRMQLLISKRDWAQLSTDFSLLPEDVKQMPYGKAVGGLLAVRKGDFNGAKQIAPLLEKYPSDEFLRWTVAGYSKDPSLKSEIIPFLERYTGNYPKSAIAWFMLGNEYAGKGAFEKAVEPYRKAAEFTPSNGLVLNNLAYSELKVGNFTDAVKHAYKAVSASPKQAPFVETLATALIETGKNADAVDVMERFLDSGAEVNDVFKATLEKARSM